MRHRDSLDNIGASIFWHVLPEKEVGMMIISMNFGGFHVPRNGFGGFTARATSPASGTAPC
jgi:hypothetical protein